MKTDFLPGEVRRRVVQTKRLRTAYLEAGTGTTWLVLLHRNVVSSRFFEDFMVALAGAGPYRVYAPDMRGFGESDPLPVDAARGVRDFSDDLAAFTDALGLSSFHLLGWSLGGNVAMQFAIDYSGRLGSLLLEATGSPFGLLGTRDEKGTPTWPDYAGSGGGTVSARFVASLAQKDRSDHPTAPRSVMNRFYFKPPFRLPPAREEHYLNAFLITRIGPQNYPGDSTVSPNWPHVSPGTEGVLNAFSPKYLNQWSLVYLRQKPPILWLHGTNDQVVADESALDLAVQGKAGLVPGWPGEELYPPQPMKRQIRRLLEQYRQNGGVYREVILTDCGHTPHLEQPGQVLKHVMAFLTDALEDRPI
jgi:pimeloyl-ACP methyl ester carboxylesterase